MVLKNQLRDPGTAVLPMDTQWPFSVKQSGMALFLACVGGLTYHLPPPRQRDNDDGGIY